MVERWRLACREHRVAQERGVLTWRLVLRREYRQAMATRNPRRLVECLREVSAIALAWADAIEERAQ